MSERSIFANALELENAAERAAYLDEACNADPELRRRIEQLLHAYNQPGQFLDVPALEQLVEDPVSSGDDPILPGEETVGLEGSSVNDSRRKSNRVGDKRTRQPAEKEDEVHAFLQPSDRPGSLGRLGHYEVEEILGKGAFGIVFRAFDEKLRRVVAIKVMAPQLATNGTARQRFIREARAAAAVRNEHVVSIHAVHEAGSLPFLVMEFIHGTTLDAKIAKEGGLEVKEILRIGMQVARGLAAAHQQGLIHRDIKPANILLENGVQRVKITDFGLARTVDDASLTASGMIAGTPLYMAPEQARGEALDHRTDLFSLGSVLYALCTGRPAFRADSTVAVLRRVCEDVPRPIRELNPDIPDHLEAIITRLMAKEAADRFQAAEETAQVLEDYLAHLQQPAMVARPRGGNVRPVPPRRGVTVFAIVAGMLLAGGTCILTWFAIRSGQEAEPGKKSPAKLFGAPVPPVLKDASAHLALGKSLVKNNQPDKARIQFENALAVDPGNTEAASELANLVLEGRWTVLHPGAMQSSGGAVLTLEEDGGILVSGENPDRAVYTLQFKIQEKILSAIRIQILPDPRLPSGGAGRFPNNGNFMLGELKAAVVSDGGVPEPKSFSSAMADYPQAGNFAVDNTLDGDPITGWSTSPQTAQRHEAIFAFETPVSTKNRTLILTLDSGTLRNQHGLGRFRLSMAREPAPSDIQKRTIVARNLANPWERLAAAYQLSLDQVALAKLTNERPESLLGLVKICCEVDDLPGASAYYAMLRKAGDFPKALVFTTGRDSVTAEHFPLDTYDAFTIEGWVYGWRGQMIQQGFPSDPENSFYVVYGNIDAWKYSGWEAGDGTNHDVLLPYDGKPGWRHIAMTYDGKQRSFFLDGHLLQTNTVPKPGPLSKSRPLNLGGRGTEGLLGAVRISSVVRYADAFTPPKNLTSDDKTVLLYDLSRQDSDTALLDLSKNGRDGKIHGMPWIVSADPDAPPLATAPFDVIGAKKHQEEWAKYLGVPVRYTNSIGMEFVLIPPGKFTMGSSPNEIENARKALTIWESRNWKAKNWHENMESESPLHEVILLQPFYLGIYEVTQENFEAVMGKNPSSFSALGRGKKSVAGTDTANHPVEKVNWPDAARFCNRLNLEENRKSFDFNERVTMASLKMDSYRLPTEAEWEFACRAGTTTSHWIGDRDGDLVRACWFGTNSRACTQPVGELAANPLGLFDVHGNVFEWVLDWWGPTYYEKHKGVLAVNPHGPAGGSQRVIRGGDWKYIPALCRSSFRGAVVPTYGYGTIGFRVALPIAMPVKSPKPGPEPVPDP